MKNARVYSESRELSLDQKNFLSLSLLLMLALNFTLSYLTFTYYAETILDPETPGFWINLASYMVIFGIVLLNKKALSWNWSILGLARPKSWGRPLFTFIGCFAAIRLLYQFLVPSIIETFGEHRNISFIYTVKQDLSNLILALTVVWITAAFIEELVFRAFLINSLDYLFGGNKISVWVAVILSSLIFGMIHSYQGITGILITTFVGLIFGIGYIFNKRRILPLILVHGIIDSLTLISVYNS